MQRKKAQRIPVSLNAKGVASSVQVSSRNQLAQHGSARTAALRKARDLIFAGHSIFTESFIQMMDQRMREEGGRGCITPTTPHPFPGDLLNPRHERAAAEDKVAAIVSRKPQGTVSEWSIPVPHLWVSTGSPLCDRVALLAASILELLRAVDLRWSDPESGCDASYSPDLFIGACYETADGRRFFGEMAKPDDPRFLPGDVQLTWVGTTTCFWMELRVACDALAGLVGPSYQLLHLHSLMARAAHPLRWVESQRADLHLVEGEVAMIARQLPQVHLSTADASQTLTNAQLRVWNALDGAKLNSREIGAVVKSRTGCSMDDSNVRSRIAEMRSRGFKVARDRMGGYYRPDAPPGS